jgi:predicted nucleic acid-binding protein
VIVIDASAIVALILMEKGYEKVSEIIRVEKPVYTVDHAIKEVANAIWKATYLKKVISNDSALKIYKGFIKLVETHIIRVENESRYIDKAMEIALRYGIPVYDALYIAQALIYGELLTFDQIQARIAKELGIRVHFVT